MKFDITLENEFVKIVPLRTEDFDELYKVAADPLMWLQHPNKNRYKRAEFLNFFAGAMESGGAFKIIDKRTGDYIGSTRFYEWEEKEKSVSIGYTFYAVAYWGKGYNSAVKQLMIEYALQNAEKIHFHIGAKNMRSQVAIERLGAEKIDAKMMKYHGENEHEGLIYRITPKSWEDYLKAKEEEEKEKEQEG